MKKEHLKQIFLMVGLLSITWCSANDSLLKDKYSQIQIVESNVTAEPKGTYINASISGHTLTVVFSQNLGDVDVEVLSTSGNFMHNAVTQTPTGVQVYIPLAGHYTVTFTLSNGDVYYGEFDVTD